MSENVPGMAGGLWIPFRWRGAVTGFAKLSGARSKGRDPELQADGFRCRYRKLPVTRHTRAFLVGRVPPDRVSAALTQRFAALVAKVPLEIAQPDHETVRRFVTVATIRR